MFSRAFLLAVLLTVLLGATSCGGGDVPVASTEEPTSVEATESAATVFVVPWDRMPVSSVCVEIEETYYIDSGFSDTPQAEMIGSRWSYDALWHEGVHHEWASEVLERLGAEAAGGPTLSTGAPIAFGEATPVAQGIEEFFRGFRLGEGQIDEPGLGRVDIVSAGCDLAVKGTVVGAVVGAEYPGGVRYPGLLLAGQLVLEAGDEAPLEIEVRHLGLPPEKWVEGTPRTWPSQPVDAVSSPSSAADHELRDVIETVRDTG
ncbi:MAG: hypothetical protein WBM50_12880 [Acidimicrobiales bacterium]